MNGVGFSFYAFESSGLCFWNGGVGKGEVYTLRVRFGGPSSSLFEDSCCCSFFSGGFASRCMTVSTARQSRMRVPDVRVHRLTYTVT